MISSSERTMPGYLHQSPYGYYGMHRNVTVLVPFVLVTRVDIARCEPLLVQ